MLKIKTSNPQALLKKFEDAIAGKIKPEITTWRKVASGDHKGKFTHTSSEQKDLAFLEVTVVDDDKTKELRFRVTYPDPAPENRPFTYSYYHGHMLVTILSHFNSDVITVVATPYV